MKSQFWQWARVFASTAFGGSADGFLAAAGGSTAAQLAGVSPAGGKLILLTMAANAALDCARFVKANPDPWLGPVNPPPPAVTLQAIKVLTPSPRP